MLERIPAKNQSPTKGRQLRILTVNSTWTKGSLPPRNWLSCASMTASAVKRGARIPWLSFGVEQKRSIGNDCGFSRDRLTFS